MYFIVIFILEIFWAAIFIFIEILKIKYMIGGAFFLFMLIPIFLMLCLKYKDFYRLIFSILLGLIFLIIINIMHSYLSTVQAVDSPYLYIFIIFHPILFVAIAYVNVIHYFLPIDKRNRFEKNIEAQLRSFSWVIFITIVMQPQYTILVLAEIYGKKLLNPNTLGYPIGLGFILAGGLMFLFILCKIPLMTLNYYLNHFDRCDNDINKFNKLFILFLSVIIIGSASCEWRYRGRWIIWGESILSLILLILIAYTFVRVLFIPRIDSDIRHNHNELPSIKRREIKNILWIFFTIYFFILFYL